MIREPLRHSLPALLLPLFLLAGPVSGQGEIPRPTADEIPEPTLEGLEPAVAEQLAETRRFVIQQITETERTTEQLAEPIGELGRFYLAYELHGPAEECLLLAARSVPRDFSWPYHLGYLTQRTGRLEEAATYYERALSIVPNVGPAKIRLGRVYMDLNRPERAEWVLRDALRGNPSSAAAMAALGELLVSLERYPEGEALLRGALDLQPGADRLYYPLALALRGRGEENAARALMAKRGTVGIRPADPLIDGLAELAIGERVHLLRGQAAYQAGRFEDAAEQFSSAIEMRPGSVSGYINLGSALGQLGKIDEAIEQFRKAAEIAPANTAALYNLGSLLRRQGRLEDALDQFRNAALYAPRDGGVRFQLADALRLTGHEKESLIHFRDAAELEPPGELARFREAQVLNKLGLDAAAVQRLKEGLQLIPRSSLLSLTLARLLVSSPDLDLRDGRQALEILDKAPIRRSIRSFETLAMAHAEVGECDQAVNWQSQAWEAALEFDEKSLAESLKSTLDRYENDRPCRYVGASAAAADPVASG